MKSYLGHKYSVTVVVFSPDGKRIASCSGDKTLKVWESESGHELNTFSGHKQGVSSVAFSPDGERIVVGSTVGTITIYDISSPEEVEAEPLAEEEGRSWIRRD